MCSDALFKCGSKVTEQCGVCYNADCFYLAWNCLLSLLLWIEDSWQWLWIILCSLQCCFTLSCIAVFASFFIDVLVEHYNLAWFPFILVHVWFCLQLIADSMYCVASTWYWLKVLNLSHLIYRHWVNMMTGDNSWRRNGMWNTTST